MKRHVIYLVIFLSGVARCLAEVSATCDGESWSDSIMALPQVSVTAMKLGADLQDKPVSATVIGTDDIERQGIVNLHQVSDMVPNLYMPRYGSRITSSIYVRGIGARIDQPAVGLTVDNIPVINKDNYDFDLDDMVNIDMIRGPQSTMYGRNTMCGLINITTLSPLRFSGVKLGVEGGSYGNYRARAAGYHKLGDRLGVAAGVTVAGTDGYFKNAYNGCRVGAERQWSAWYKVAWLPVAGWSVENTGRFNHSRQSGYPYCQVGAVDIAYNDTCFYRRNSFLDALTVGWRHDGWSVTSVTSVQHINDNMTLDQDFTSRDYFTLTQRRHETSVTQDFIVKHDSDRYNWLSGVFMFTRHTSMRAPVTFKPYGIARLIEDHRNDANPSYPIKWDDDSFVLHSDFSHPTRGIGIYHSSTLELQQWALTAALRLDIERPSLDFHSYTSTSYTIYDNTGVRPTVYRHENVNLDERGKLSHTYVQLLPRLSALYRLPSSLGNVYASFSEGYKPGGYNTQMFSDFLQQKLMATMGMSELYNVDEIVGYRPERSFNYEVGTHLELWDGRLSLDGAAFYIDCRDQQLTRFPDGSTTGRIMDNAGRTRSLGAELSARCHFDRHWTASASWGHVDARFVDYDDGKEDYGGKYVPYAPLNTFYGSVNYAVALPAVNIDRLEVMGAVNGVGRIYWNETNTVSQCFYAPLKLSVSISSGMFTLRLWGENLNGVKYSTFYFKSIGNEFVQRGAPRTFGASLAVDVF
ncbi:MAG: TonB-dependent receptor plug domain-containing protein [Clostridiales bacterium]|nr:TonB-dependent receptor plug domain-containing protein [Clostridiales bacterium]